MQICRVLGTVVSTHKTEKLSGMKLLLTRAIDLDTFTEKGPLLVSVDTIGAGEGEVVMTVGGSSSRQTAQTDNTPVDSAIVAIIDHIDLSGNRIFDKFGEPSTDSKNDADTKSDRRGT